MALLLHLQLQQGKKNLQQPPKHGGGRWRQPGEPEDSSSRERYLRHAGSTAVSAQLRSPWVAPGKPFGFSVSQGWAQGEEEHRGCSFLLACPISVVPVGSTCGVPQSGVCAQVPGHCWSKEMFSPCHETS